MNRGEEAMALLLRPVRHAVNNLSMVLSANLEAAVPKLPPGERATAQVERARRAAEDYDRLIRGYFALGRQESVKAMPADRFLRDLMPLLVLASGGALALEVEEGGTIEARSPALEAALVLAAAGGADLPPGQRPPLRLRGTSLAFGWTVPDAAREALLAAGASADTATVGLPTAATPG